MTNSDLMEGAMRLGSREYRQFVGIARGSAGEVCYQLLLAKDLNYINDDTYRELRSGYDRVLQMLFPAFPDPRQCTALSVVVRSRARDTAFILYPFAFILYKSRSRDTSTALSGLICQWFVTDGQDVFCPSE